MRERKLTTGTVAITHNTHKHHLSTGDRECSPGDLEKKEKLTQTTATELLAVSIGCRGMTDQKKL